MLFHLKLVSRLRTHAHACYRRKTGKITGFCQLSKFFNTTIRCATLDNIIEHHSPINLATFNLAEKSQGFTLGMDFSSRHPASIPPFRKNIFKIFSIPRFNWIKDLQMIKAFVPKVPHDRVDRFDEINYTFILK